MNAHAAFICCSFVVSAAPVIATKEEACIRGRKNRPCPLTGLNNFLYAAVTAFSKKDHLFNEAFKLTAVVVITTGLLIR